MHRFGHLTSFYSAYAKHKFELFCVYPRIVCHIITGLLAQLFTNLTSCDRPRLIVGEEEIVAYVYADAL